MQRKPLHRSDTMLPAIGAKATRSINEKMREWKVFKKTTNTIQEIADKKILC